VRCETDVDVDHAELMSNAPRYWASSQQRPAEAGHEYLVDSLGARYRADGYVVYADAISASLPRGWVDKQKQLD
jgi:hypothetical protein